jgi:hypothetical protein
LRISTPFAMIGTGSTPVSAMRPVNTEMDRRRPPLRQSGRGKHRGDVEGEGFFGKLFDQRHRGLTFGVRDRDLDITPPSFRSCAPRAPSGRIRPRRPQRRWWGLKASPCSCGRGRRFGRICSGSRFRHAPVGELTVMPGHQSIF